MFRLQTSSLSFAAVAFAATLVQAEEPVSPRLAAIQALGQQNLNSIASSPRMGGPQGISVHELPAAAAYCEAQRVDAIYAVRAGASDPIPQIQLAHPSHVPGVPGSRPFVSHGPVSRSPGSNRRISTPYPYGHVSQTSVPTAQLTLHASPANEPQLTRPAVSPTIHSHRDLPGASGSL